MLPIYMKTLELLKGTLPSLTMAIPVAPNQHVQGYLYKIASTCTLPRILISGESLAEKYDAFHVRRYLVILSYECFFFFSRSILDLASV